MAKLAASTDLVGVLKTHRFGKTSPTLQLPGKYLAHHELQSVDPDQLVSNHNKDG